ncbi:MAG: hypothetical protein IAE88_10480 [Rhodobacteraceae bacterium]|nr:hypothetical protein [Paracoccaceae bacterium]
MLNIPTYSGRSPDIANYGNSYNGVIQVLTKLDGFASADATLQFVRGTINGQLSVFPELVVGGAGGGFPPIFGNPDPGTYAPLPPEYGLFCIAPVYQSGTGPWATYSSVLRIRIRSVGATNPNISTYSDAPNTWFDPATIRYVLQASTTNYVGTASCLLDLSVNGGTTSYQTYLIRFVFLP